MTNANAGYRAVGDALLEKFGLLSLRGATANKPAKSNVTKEAKSAQRTNPGATRPFRPL